jgi:hypothetical protein
MKAGSKFAVESVDTTLLQTSLKVESLGKTEFKSGSLFNVDAAGKMSLKSGGIYALDATGIYNNCSKSVSVDKLGAIQVNKLPDVTKNDSTDNFTSTPELLNTIVTVAPTHEPYFRGQTGVFFKPTSPGIQPQTAYDGAVDATKGVTGPVPNPPTDKDLRNQPPCDCQIGNLSSDQMTAYFAAIGKSESGGVYNKVNSIGYVGKYQFGYPALIDGGYVKSSVRSNAQLQNPNSWTGKNGVSSVQDWLGNSTEQEAAMCAYTKRNYSTMCKIGAVTQDQPPEDVAGMLAVSHLLGPGGAKDFRNGKSSADAYGTTGSAYFQKGKYAVAVLAPQAPAVKAG